MIATVAAVAILVPWPWYAHQLRRYDSALFGQPHPEEPVWSRRPLGFFVGAGLPGGRDRAVPAVVLASFLPIAYTEAWGDYFGVWRWFPGGDPPSAGVRRELVTMSIVGLPFTLVAVPDGSRSWVWPSVIPGAPPSVLLVALLPLAALAGGSCTSGRRTRHPTATR